MPEISNFTTDLHQMCEGSYGGVRCRQRKIANSRFCKAHTKPEKMANLRVNTNVLFGRLSELSSSDNIKSLRDEIAILRLIIEGKLNLVKDATDLMLYSDDLRDLVDCLQRSLKTMNQIDISSGNMLDKSTILSYTEKILEIIANEVSDHDVAIRIAEGIRAVMLNIDALNNRAIAT